MASFVKHTSCESCGSKDNFALYSDNSGHCFGCGFTVVSEEYKQKNKSNVKGFSKKEKELEEKVEKKPAITKDQFDEIKSITTVDGKGFRGITTETYSTFGVRHAFDEDGEVLNQYYPVTEEGELVGVKIREVPKNFRSIGRTGATCDLFMQFKFNRGGKYVIITEGECDALAAYQMMKEYSDTKGGDYETAVVSPTTGANSQKQIANQYKFLDSFENIILCFDNDKAGQDAIEKVIEVLPKGKVKVMQMRYKDANQYLDKGKQSQFVADFYDSKKRIPTDVLPSGGLYDKIIRQTEVQKVPFPDFMSDLNDMMVGGIPLGHIINVAADTGVGKTTLVNEMIYYWIFNSPHTIGVVSMELDSGQYGEVLLSRHLERKLSLIRDQSEKIKFLQSDAVRKAAKELTYKYENDEEVDRFYLLDNRDGSVEEIQKTIEQLVVACGVKIVVLDPLQDVLDGLSNEEQAVFMKWAKGFIKSHGVTFIFINHMRKTPAGQDGADSEQNIMGSSTIIKSASANILLRRDKMSDDPIVRNTTTILLTKNRICGITGPAGEIYYDNDEHKLYNKRNYFS